MAQFIVIVQILIPERDPEHPLPDQRHYLVLYLFLTSLIVKARREPIHHPDCTVGRTQQQRTGIRNDRTGVKCRHHLAAFNECKSKQIRDTLCWHRGAPRSGEKWLPHSDFR
jgi:hypothetical protein